MNRWAGARQSRLPAGAIKSTESLAFQLSGVSAHDEIGLAGKLFTEKFPKLAEYSGMFEWVGRVGPVPMYRITPKIVSYMDYQKMGFNRYETLELG